jgi:predicted N-formylglutamate amidohydrolase
MADGQWNPVRIENPDGAGSFVIVCDHASNRIPDELDGLGLSEELIGLHIAWDPGALPVARDIARRLDAPLCWPDISRLVIDCNRAPDAKDLVLAASEGREVPGNRTLSPDDKGRRLAAVHAPYHDAIGECLARRKAVGLPTALVAIHSFTPVYLGQSRPWQVGVVFGEDRRLADPIIRKLKEDARLTVGVNEPYAPEDGVYYTLRRHGGAGRLPTVMIEIRSDEITNESGQRDWARRLAEILKDSGESLFGTGHAAA